jgi:hypothetical protein
MFSALIYQFPFLFIFLKKNYFLQTLKAAVKRNVGSAATSDEPQSKMAKVCETPEAIASTSGVSSEVQQEPLAEPPVILNDLSDPSEAQNIIKECENCAPLKVENRKLRNRVRALQESLAKRKSESRKLHRKGNFDSKWKLNI